MYTRCECEIPSYHTQISSYNLHYIHEASACRSMCCPAILCYDVIVQGMFCHSKNSENECTILAFCGVTLHSTGMQIHTHTHLWWQRQVLMLTAVLITDCGIPILYKWEFACGGCPVVVGRGWYIGLLKMFIHQHFRPLPSLVYQPQNCIQSYTHYCSVSTSTPKHALGKNE